MQSNHDSTHGLGATQIAVAAHTPTGSARKWSTGIGMSNWVAPKVWFVTGSVPSQWPQSSNFMG
ncbi:MAG: hypothetical protein ACYC3A_09235 [Halothiobacillus sp.]